MFDFLELGLGVQFKTIGGTACSLQKQSLLFSKRMLSLYLVWKRNTSIRYWGWLVVIRPKSNLWFKYPVESTNRLIYGEIS